ncbi:hypothetical protein D3C85_1220870 [compost metagenome]
MKKHSLTAVAAAAIVGSALTTPAAIAAAAPAPALPRMTREEFELHMKHKLKETELADKLEFWHGQAMLHLVAGAIDEERAFELAMRLAESSCSFREWELWPTPEDVVAKWLKDNPQ